MKTLEVNYLGLKLRTPLVVSSSGLTASVEKIKKLEDAGAGAVVLKSLFQEQIMHEATSYDQNSDYPEAHDYIMNYAQENSIAEYLLLIKEAKAATSIPIIASINCTSSGDWIKFASKIEAAGADALELNIYFLAHEKSTSAFTYEAQYLDIVEKVRQAVSIPISVKMAKSFTNITYMVDQLFYRRVEGVVLFNRLYEPDINIDKLVMASSDVFSSSTDLRDTLRWIGIVSSEVPNVNLGASTGVHDGVAAIKMLLAGATVVEVCSAVYKKGPDVISQIISQLSAWMDEHSFNSIDEFRGSMSYKNIESPDVYERAQFMRYFSKFD